MLASPDRAPSESFDEPLVVSIPEGSFLNSLSKNVFP